jgi:hypothetical protein
MTVITVDKSCASCWIKKGKICIKCLSSETKHIQK